jgi:hypothetical protein
MSLELTEDAEAKLLEVKASGKLSKEDYEHFEPAVSGLIEASGKIKILFVMHEFHGCSLPTRSIATSSAMRMKAS